MCRSPKKLKSLIEVRYIVAVKVHVLSFNMILISSPQRVPTPSYPFLGNLGDQVKGRSPKKLKSLIEVPYVAQLIVQDLIFNMNISLLCSVFLDRGIHFGEKLGDQEKCQGKCYSPKKLKPLIEVTKVAHLEVQVVSFNMNHIFSPQHVPRQIYPKDHSQKRSNR